MMSTGPRRVGVFGGTFDPIHVGHVAAARRAKEEFSLELVVFVPSGHPWQKDHYSSAEDRFMMTTLGSAADQAFAVSRLELDRRGPTYTLDTMVTLRDFYGPTTKLFFITGADAALNLGTWKDVERLAEYCEFIALTRPGFDLDRLERGPGWPVVTPLEMDPVDVSATDIRQRVVDGVSVEGLVVPDVARYIEERGLYRSMGTAS
ncbi:MAG: nicotinate-nucleotide adenylyltransferase [Actinomycetota bacterium]|jgi:nicotinate-nucleotide adenylyltransferase|nr:nicotinate-nucleotide adenylyltransferase [Actinomycetota bacterium]